MGKLRHGEAKWPSQERTWIRRTSQPADTRTWGWKGHNEKAVGLSRPGGGVGDGEGKPSRSGHLGQAGGAKDGCGHQPSAGAPPTGHRCCCSRQPLVEEDAQRWRDCSLEDRRPPRLPGLEQEEPRGRPNLFTLHMANAKLRGVSGLLKGSQQASGMWVSRSSCLAV